VRGADMHVYGYLKNFLFPREFLDKKIGVLSGGEKTASPLPFSSPRTSISLFSMNRPTISTSLRSIF
jgi:ATPase components of ABC transporters with duplicated ATPase domains